MAVLAGPSSNPDQLHFSWQQDPSTSITAVWRTDVSVTGSVLEYGIGELADSVEGYSYSYSGGHGILHVAEATGLEPNTVYQVRVGDGAGHSSGIENIVTAPLPDDVCQSYSFVLLGDSRSTVGDGVSIWWPTLLDVATDQSPDFMLFNGDAIKEGDNQDGWDDFFDPGDMAYCPLMPVWGNHEDRGGSKYLPQYALPINDRTATEDFYSLRYGNALFLALDTEHGAAQYLTQQSWMHDQLGGSDALWKFAFFHRPAYSSGTTHGSEPEVQQYLVPLFDQYHIDAAFGSHDHMYERTVPIYNDHQVEQSEGTVYFVSGGAGAFVNPIGGMAWFTDKFLGMMHVLLVEVDFDRARFTMIGATEVTWETYEIFKPGIGKPTAAFTIDPLPATTGQTVRFDGSDSFDPCDELANYSWQFGDGTAGEGVIPEHIYNEPGTYSVALIVTDSDEQTAQLVQQLEVLEGSGDDDDDDSSDDDDQSGDDDDDDADGCGC
ncbi:MAG: PKD domain-containing protein [Candidatus Alcyoniella australis]|nr:PKD domain-containing protein [Candidatus Alcyoniella australis]